MKRKMKREKKNVEEIRDTVKDFSPTLKSLNSAPSSIKAGKSKVDE